MRAQFFNVLGDKEGSLKILNEAELINPHLEAAYNDFRDSNTHVRSLQRMQAYIAVAKTVNQKDMTTNTTTTTNIKLT